MYYPYLRGKQFELLCLREFAMENQNNSKIVPIIEPVKQQVKSINVAIDAMIDSKVRFAVVLNPTDGDFKHVADNDIIKQIPRLLSENEAWIPSYIYRNNGNDLLKHADMYGLTGLMIIFPNGANVNDTNTMDFLQNDKIKFIVSGNLGANRSTRVKLLRIGKSVISLEERFKDLTRNADYANNPDEMFSEDFAFYREDGLTGFADYVTMGKDLVEGGMLPYAIAIHLTYQKYEEQIFVHHFVSDNNFNQTNIRGKFREAAIKIEPFYRDGGYVHTSAVDELIEKANSDNGYPGLGYIKKLSLMNHLELINRIISD